MLWPIHVIWQREKGIQVFRHADELYILIKQNTNGYSGPLALYLANSVTMVFGGSIKDLREDLIVFHIRQGKLHKYFHKHIPGGIAYVFQNALYYGSGGSKIRDWRWNGTGFEQISDSEAAKVDPDNRYKFNKKLQEQQGWFSLDHDENLSPSLPIKLGNRIYVLSYAGATSKLSSWGTKKRISLKGPGLVHPEQVLYEVDNSYQRVPRKTYMGSGSIYVVM